MRGMNKKGSHDSLDCEYLKTSVELLEAVCAAFATMLGLVPEVDLVAMNKGMVTCVTSWLKQ